MLVLSRKQSEGLVLDGRIRVRVLGVCGTRVKLGIEAPDDVAILRDELVSQSSWAGGDCASPNVLECPEPC